MVGGWTGSPYTKHKSQADREIPLRTGLFYVYVYGSYPHGLKQGFGGTFGILQGTPDES
jgi:hypothetical protein